MFTLLCWTFNNKLPSQNILIVVFFFISLFLFYFYLLFFFYIILDVYNGLNLPFQLVGYSHLFCFLTPVKKYFLQ